MLINGDCFEEILKIPDRSVDLILTDPPYFISRESRFHETSEDNVMNFKYEDHHIDFGDWDKGEIDWNFLFSEYYRVLKKHGSLIIFYDSWKSNIIKEAADNNKFKQPRIGLWVKSNPVPINSKLNYLSNAIEYFYTFVKVSKPTFNSEYDNGIYTYPIEHGKIRYKHPTQKSLRLIESLIEKHSNEGDLILDTFAGTGTTAHACINLNRKYIMIENNEEYFKMMEYRIK